MPKIAIAALLFLVLTSSCSSNNEEMKKSDILLENTTNAFADSAVAAPVLETTQNEEQNKEANDKTEWEQKIIKTGTLRVRVNQISEYEKWVVQKTQSAGGYVLSDEQYSQEGSGQKTMVLKVPVQRFDTLMKTLCKEGLQVLERSIRSEDVSQEFYDLNTRIASKKKILQQYLNILSKAQKVSDILEVQAEINRIQEELEAVQGRAQYLAHQSTLSTLTLYIESGNKSETLEPAFLSKLADSMLNGWNFLKGTVLGVVAIWPLWLLIGLGVWVWKRGKKVRNKKQ